MNTIELREFKQSLTLTSLQKEILVGLLLGDGHLETQDRGRTYRLKIEHSITQKEYVLWKFNQFKKWVRTPPQERVSKRYDVLYRKYWFNTVSHGAFRFFAQQFYGTSVKRIPPLIKKMLTPIALAVWYMDDGSIKSHQTRARILNTHAFSAIDRVLLRDVLQKKFGIATTLRHQKDGVQLYIPASEIEKFHTVIEPFIIPSMRYKL